MQLWLDVADISLRNRRMTTINCRSIFIPTLSAWWLNVASIRMRQLYSNLDGFYRVFVLHLGQSDLQTGCLSHYIMAISCTTISSLKVLEQPAPLMFIAHNCLGLVKVPSSEGHESVGLVISMLMIFINPLRTPPHVLCLSMSQYTLVILLVLLSIQ